ncbi:ATP synthase I chain [Mariprofundus aestuarium]|uniref:ATP synthase I chain n=1 Tax=Mariprofundus aestuarium TaxID=1921086 RepID=A0A2K8KW73_MARES|nr:ATP synthase subunit I [Mariprofundus aestuarium]ATX78892.1 ATP synthase I chain [Mariprofundus aestuarium]
MSLLKESAVGLMVRLQILVGAVGFIGLMLYDQSNAALSLLYGVTMMVVNSLWLSRRLDKTRGMDVSGSKRSLYVGAVLRFVALIAGLMLAHLAGLHLLVVAAGVFVAQAVVFVSALIGFRKEYKGGGLG